MTLAEQCCTLEQAKRLKELGVAQESLYYHLIGHYGTHDIGTECTKGWTYVDPESNEVYTASNYEEAGVWSAFTTSELGLMLPTLGFEYIKSNNGNGEDFLQLSSKYWQLLGAVSRYKNETHLRADMLIYLLEGGLTTPAEVNQRLYPSITTA